MAPEAFGLAFEGALIDSSRALALARLGRLGEARHLLEKIRPILADVAGREVADARAEPALWQADLRLGQVLAAEGQGAAAAAAYRRALAAGAGGRGDARPAADRPFPGGRLGRGAGRPGALRGGGSGGAGRGAAPGGGSGRSVAALEG